MDGQHDTREGSSLLTRRTAKYSNSHMYCSMLNEHKNVIIILTGEDDTIWFDSQRYNITRHHATNCSLSKPNSSKQEMYEYFFSVNTNAVVLPIKTIEFIQIGYHETFDYIFPKCPSAENIFIFRNYWIVHCTMYILQCTIRISSQGEVDSLSKNPWTKNLLAVSL